MKQGIREYLWQNDLLFASIYQSNLDEFYMVRVGTLMDQMESSEVVRENKTNMTSKEQVKAIIDATRELDIKKAVIYEQLMGELSRRESGLSISTSFQEKEGELLETYFDNEIAPYLSREYHQQTAAASILTE